MKNNYQGDYQNIQYSLNFERRYNNYIIIPAQYTVLVFRLIILKNNI